MTFAEQLTVYHHPDEDAAKLKAMLDGLLGHCAARKLTVEVTCQPSMIAKLGEAVVVTGAMQRTWEQRVLLGSPSYLRPPDPSAPGGDDA